MNRQNEEWERHVKLLKELDEKPKVDRALKLVDKKIELSAHRNERNLMLFPFCSTSRRKRISTIKYTTVDGKRWLHVTANAEYGMAKIWDFDVLRYALSKAGEIARMKDCAFPPCVDFTAYECLKAIGRDTKGKGSFKWLEEALCRLASTTYRGNIFRENEKITEIFTLIKVIYKKNEENDQIQGIRIVFDERLIESARYAKGLLKIDSAILNEDSGLKKRLLELVKVSKGSGSEWTVRLERLQALCAHEGTLKGFKREIKNYPLPWRVKFSSQKILKNDGENITFYDFD